VGWILASAWRKQHYVIKKLIVVALSLAARLKSPREEDQDQHEKQADFFESGTSKPNFIRVNLSTACNFQIT
jgi:hypothetical protein